MPSLLRALILWLHLLAAITWIGSVVFLVLVVFPTLAQAAPTGERLRFALSLEARCRVIVWPAVGLVLFTGLVNLMNVWYVTVVTGGNISPTFVRLLSVKLGLVLGMIAVQAVQQLLIYPKRLAALRDISAGVHLGDFRVKGVRRAGARPPSRRRRRGAHALRRLARAAASRASSAATPRWRRSRRRSREAQAGNGQVVGVVAEAGTGKSRLCFEFLERCRARGMTVNEGRAVAHGQEHPLPADPRGVPRLLRHHRAGRRPHRAREDRRAHAAARRGLPRDACRCSSTSSASPTRSDPVPRSIPRRGSASSSPSLRRVIQGADAAAPSARHADRGPALARRRRARRSSSSGSTRSPASRASWSLNFRPEYRADWMQKSYYRQIPLAPLGAEAIRELLARPARQRPEHAGLADGDPRAHRRQPVLHRGGGAVADRVGASRGHAAAPIGCVTPIERLEVPASVQAVLAARIDRLPEREKQVLQTAAVIGKEFAEPILARCSPRPAATLANGELARGARRRSKAREFVYEQALYPVAEYAFKHPLTQEVALGSQLQERRRQVHAAVARAIEAAHADKLDEHAALLAHHWEEAGEALAAARWHARAATFIGKNDFAESARHWQRARELLRRVADDPSVPDLGANACFRVLSLGFRIGLSEEAPTGLRGRTRVGGAAPTTRSRWGACTRRCPSRDRQQSHRRCAHPRGGVGACRARARRTTIGARARSGRRSSHCCPR